MSDWFNFLRRKGIDIHELDMYDAARSAVENSVFANTADEAIDALVEEILRLQSLVQSQEHIDNRYAFDVLLEARRLKDIANKMGVSEQLLKDPSWLD